MSAETKISYGLLGMAMLTIITLISIREISGVPLRFHDDVYEILQMESSSKVLSSDSQVKQYTEPFKQYSYIDEEVLYTPEELVPFEFESYSSKPNLPLQPSLMDIETGGDNY